MAELEKGWLREVLDDVHKDVLQWPKWMTDLSFINQLDSCQDSKIITLHEPEGSRNVLDLTEANHSVDEVYLDLDELKSNRVIFINLDRSFVEREVDISIPARFALDVLQYYYKSVALKELSDQISGRYKELSLARSS